MHTVEPKFPTEECPIITGVEGGLGGHLDHHFILQMRQL